MATVGQLIILATVIVFLCHLHDTGLRFLFNNGIDFYRLYDAKKFFSLMAFVLVGSTIGAGIYFSARQKIEDLESRKFNHLLQNFVSEKPRPNRRNRRKGNPLFA